MPGFTFRFASEEDFSIQYVANGGTITFSPDKNVGMDTVKKRLKSWWDTTVQRVFHQKKIDRAVMRVHFREQDRSQKTGESYYGLGYKKESSGKGMYYPQGKGTPAVKEVSYELTFAGVPSEVLKILAESIRKEFDQESVLVHDRNANESYFKYKNKPREEAEEEDRYRTACLYTPLQIRKILASSKKPSRNPEIPSYIVGRGLRASCFPGL